MAFWPSYHLRRWTFSLWASHRVVKSFRPLGENKMKMVLLHTTRWYRFCTKTVESDSLMNSRKLNTWSVWKLKAKLVKELSEFACGCPLQEVTLCVLLLDRWGRRHFQASFYALAGTMSSWWFGDGHVESGFSRWLEWRWIKYIVGWIGWVFLMLHEFFCVWYSLLWCWKLCRN